jgi:D-beta-D-heptose 7-phosphate kinase / D-beta-D-heptose 1-phosphate adenosyltransferase
MAPPARRNRVRSFDEMPGLIGALGRVGLNEFLFRGVFNIVHAGHTGLLRAVRRLAPAYGVIVIGLENDVTVQLNKRDTRPVNPLPDRLAVVTKFRSASYAFGYDDTPRYDHPEDYLTRWRALSP